MAYRWLRVVKVVGIGGPGSIRLLDIELPRSSRESFLVWG